jgi:hypothetical protein
MSEPSAMQDAQQTAREPDAPWVVQVEIIAAYGALMLIAAIVFGTIGLRPF